MKRYFSLFLVLILFISLFGPATGTSAASSSVTLYTAFSGIHVVPGENIHYAVDVINDSNQVQHLRFQIRDFPEEWNYQIRTAGMDLSQLSVKPNDSYNINLIVDVPLQIEKGVYQFSLIATTTQGEESLLPFVVEVSEEGTYMSQFMAEQPNMEGHSESTFRYRATLTNKTAEEQVYALAANVPQGWIIRFEADGNQISSINVDANESKSINIVVTPPATVEAGSYTIPVRAYTNETAADIELEAIITGSYDITLSTATGLLTTKATAGRAQRMELELTNTGSAPLTQVQLRAPQAPQNPINWEISFDQAHIDEIAPGETIRFNATIQPDQQAIAGDYVVNLEAITPEVTSKVALRVTVQTSMLWGWIGIAIIAAVLGGVYYLFRRYGRR